MKSEIWNLKSKTMNINYPTLSAAADLAHFRHFSSLFTVSRSTFVEIALQIHSILTNKPNFMRFSPENDDLTKNKPKTNPIQTQFPERPKLMQSVYIKRIKRKMRIWAKKNKPKTNPIQSQFQTSDISFLSPVSCILFSDESKNL